MPCQSGQLQLTASFFSSTNGRACLRRQTEANRSLAPPHFGAADNTSVSSGTCGPRSEWKHPIITHQSVETESELRWGILSDSGSWSESFVVGVRLLLALLRHCESAPGLPL